MPRALLALALALLTPAVALACEPPDPSRAPDDRPVAVAPDASFVDGSEDDGFYFFEGGPARDLGGGRVGQVIALDGGCQVAQRLLFADCTAAGAIVVWGTEPPQALAQETDAARGWLVAQSTRALQPPYGPLALGPATTVAEVAALAAREGWRVEDAEAFAAARGPRNRFDPLMGCRVLYPGSPGAAG